MPALILAAVMQALVMTTLARGTDSGVVEPREAVVRTLDEWQTLWRVHSPLPPPAVDFSTALVVAVFAGTRPTAGFHLDITDVSGDDRRMVVSYVERRPDPGDLVAQMLTSPYHIIAIPRTDRPVEFRRTESP